MSIEVPSNARGPILDLTLPASEDAIDLILRNVTTGEQLTLNLPEGWDGTDLSLDWRLRTIQDTSGEDRSALLDPEDNELWSTAEPFSGTVDAEIEALAPVEEVKGAPTAAEDNAEIGTIAWSKPGNAEASDNVYATAAMTSGATSHYLVVKEFNFPSLEDFEIEGISLEVERKAQAAPVSPGILDLDVYLVQGGAIGGTNAAKAEDGWPTVDTIASYGGASDLWGRTWTWEQAAALGVALAVTCPNEALTAYIDSIAAVVYCRPAIAYAAAATLRWEKGYY